MLQDLPAEKLKDSISPDRPCSCGKSAVPAAGYVVLGENRRQDIIRRGAASASRGKDAPENSRPIKDVNHVHGCTRQTQDAASGGNHNRAFVAAVLGMSHHTTAIEPNVDPTTGQAVKLIIRDSRGFEVRVFSYTDLREAGVPVISLADYEMDRVFGW